MPYQNCKVLMDADACACGVLGLPPSNIHSTGMTAEFGAKQTLKP